MRTHWVSTIAVGVGVGVFLLAAGSRAEISDEKHKLVKEIMAIYSVEALGQQMSQGVLADIERGYESLIEYAIKDQKDISDENRERLAARLADFSVFGAQFRERFESAMGFPEITDAIYLPLIDKYFSDKELSEILAFYRTIAGKKTLEVMPKLFSEAMGNLNEIVQSRVGFLIRDIIEAERASLEN